MALASIMIASTPTVVRTISPDGRQQHVEVQMINDDPSQTIDVSVTRTFHTAAEAARLSDEQFVGIEPGETRVGRVEVQGTGVQLVFSGVASGAGNASLRYWFSQ